MKNLGLVVFAVLVLAAPAAAQQGIQPERLPPDTFFYLHWKGFTPAESGPGASILTRLWNDPEFAPVREAMVAGLLSKMSESGKIEGVSREEVVALLGAPILAGFLPRPTAVPAEGEPQSAPAGGREFFVMDFTGRAALLERVAGLLREEGETVMRTYTFRGATIEEVLKKPEPPPEPAPEEEGEVEAATPPEKRIFRTRLGMRYVQASTQELIEDLLGRLESAEPPAASLGGSAQYQRALPLLRRDALATFFLQVPWEEMMQQMAAAEPQPGKPDPRKVLESLGLEKLHGMAGHLTAGAERLELRFGVLADTTGSLFEVFENAQQFETLPLAPPGVYSYSAGRISLPKLYAVVRQALKQALPPQQGAAVDIAEAVALMQLGKSVTDILGLFEGEFALVAPEPVFWVYSQLVALTLTDAPAFEQVLRKGLGPFLTSDEKEGETTLLTLEIPHGSSETGERRTFTYHLAITPRMLLGSPKPELLRQGLARLAAPPGAPTLLADPRYQRTRAWVPAALGSLGYSDLTKVDWEKYLDEMEDFLRQMEDKPAADTKQQTAWAAAQEPPAKPAPAPGEWRKWVNTALLKRYLHTMISGCWKNSTGIYCDTFIE